MWAVGPFGVIFINLFPLTIEIEIINKFSTYFPPPNTYGGGSGSDLVKMKTTKKAESPTKGFSRSELERAK